MNKYSHDVSSDSSQEKFLQEKNNIYTNQISLFKNLYDQTKERKPIQNSYRYRSRQFSRQNRISKQQFQIEQQARKEQQLEKLKKFKNQEYLASSNSIVIPFSNVNINNIFKKPEKKQKFNENERISVRDQEKSNFKISFSDQIKKLQNKQTDIQKNKIETIVKPKEEILQNLSNLSNFSNQNKKNFEKNAQIKQIIKDIVDRGQNKSKIYMFNEKGDKLQTGHQYYLSEKNSKVNNIARKKKLKTDNGFSLNYASDSDNQKNQIKKKSEPNVKPKKFTLNLGKKNRNQQTKQQQEKEKQQQQKKKLDMAQFEYEQVITNIPIKLIKNNLKDMIKPVSEPESHSFVRKILKHQFDGITKVEAPPNIRVKNLFDDSTDYTFIMSTLLMNECLSDIQMRLKKIVEKKAKPIQVVIHSAQKNTKNQVQIILKLHDSEKQSQAGKNQFKQMSSLHYRLGLLTNCSQITLLSNYGMPSKNNKKVFAIICFIQVSKSQEDASETMKVFGEFQPSQLQLVLMEQKSKQAWFYDMDRISSHFRQYVAITNLEHSDMSSFIYNPKQLALYQPEPLIPEQNGKMQPIFKRLQASYNQTQYKAIKQITEKQSGIFLLQGPPGTGKTTALMGLIASHYYYLQSVNSQNRVQNKILICAPSNAAINHIAKKIKNQGILGVDDNPVFPLIVRAGGIETTDPDVVDVSFDRICEREVARIQKQQEQSIIKVKCQIMELNKKLSNQKDNKQLIFQLKQLQAKLVSLPQKKSSPKKILRQVQDRVLAQCQIILTTLNSSGSDRIQSLRDKISLIIVDQAAQATEPSVIIPIQTGAIKLILVGDPKQLPATVLSQDYERTFYNKSLFERFVDEGVSPYFLNIQYRMDSMIRAYASERFYQNRLVDGQNIKARQLNTDLLPQFVRPYRGRNTIFLAVNFGEERMENNSYSNSAQAEAVSILLNRIFIDKSVSIGVITPYQSQKRKIDGLLQNSQIMVNTVDSFQGQEKDIIIVSTVRANHGGSIGFLNDDRRTNVSLTRSRHLLVVVGHTNTIANSKSWEFFIKYTKNHNTCFDIKKNQMEAQILRIMQGRAKDDDKFVGQIITRIERHTTKKSGKHNRRVYQKIKTSLDVQNQHQEGEEQAKQQQQQIGKEGKQKQGVMDEKQQ